MDGFTLAIAFSVLVGVRVGDRSEFRMLFLIRGGDYIRMSSCVHSCLEWHALTITL